MGNSPIQIHRLDQYKNVIRPFDLVLFKGGDFVSDIIRFAERKSARYDKKDYSHCGIIITREVYDIPALQEGRLYVLESTVSGRLGQGVPDIHGKSFLGVQIRDFETLLPEYLKGDTYVSIGTLRDHPLDARGTRVCRKILTKFIETNQYKIYDFNPLVLGSSVCMCLRAPKKIICSDPDKLMFCSEMVCRLYQDLGMVSEKVDAERVVPMDFLGVDVDGDIPTDFVKEIYELN